MYCNLILASLQTSKIGDARTSTQAALWKKTPFFQIFLVPRTGENGRDENQLRTHFYTHSLNPHPLLSFPMDMPIKIFCVLSVSKMTFYYIH